MSQHIPIGSAIYVRYRDHILFRNTASAIDMPIERETMGWLANENADAIRIYWDKTFKSLSGLRESPQCGLVLIKSCILELHALPLQDFLEWSLSCQKPKYSITECAFQTEKRKTQQERSKTGAEQ